MYFDLGANLIPTGEREDCIAHRSRLYLKIDAVRELHPTTDKPGFVGVFALARLRRRCGDKFGHCVEKLTGFRPTKRPLKCVLH